MLQSVAKSEQVFCSEKKEKWLLTDNCASELQIAGDSTDCFDLLEAAWSLEVMRCHSEWCCDPLTWSTLVLYALECLNTY